MEPPVRITVSTLCHTSSDCSWVSKTPRAFFQVDHVLHAVDVQALVKFAALRAELDILQRVGRIGAGAPDAGVLA